MMNKIRIWCLEKKASIPTEKEDTVGKEMEKKQSGQSYLFIDAGMSFEPTVDSCKTDNH